MIRLLLPSSTGPPSGHPDILSINTIQKYLIPATTFGGYSYPLRLLPVHEPKTRILIYHERQKKSFFYLFSSLRSYLKVPIYILFGHNRISYTPLIPHIPYIYIYLFSWHFSWANLLIIEYFYYNNGAARVLPADCLFTSVTCMSLFLKKIWRFLSSTILQSFWDWLMRWVSAT